MLAMKINVFTLYQSNDSYSSAERRLIALMNYTIFFPTFQAKQIHIKIVRFVRNNQLNWQIL